MMRSRFRALAPAFLAALTAAFAAPAGAQSTAAPADGARPVSFYLDSAAAVRALAALPAAALPEGIPPLFALYFDTAGAVRLSFGVFEQLPAAFKDPVAAVVRAHARRQAPARRPPFAFLRIATGPGASIALVENVRETPPAATNQVEVARRIQQALQRRADEVSGGRTHFRVRLRVETDGTVVPGSAEVVTSTGIEALDREATAAAYRLRFRPATVEEIPVRARVVVPFLLVLEDG